MSGHGKIGALLQNLEKVKKKKKYTATSAALKYFYGGLLQAMNKN